MILARPEVRKKVLALGAGHGRLDGIRFEVTRCHRHTGECRALLVDHDTAQRAQRRLGQRRRREQQRTQDHARRTTEPIDHAVPPC